jgi:tetratricopeptide (TPR) repeat protein
MAYPRSRLALVLLLACSLATPSLAFAQEAGEEPISLDDAKANEAKTSGDAAMDAGNFSEALGRYRDAYAIVPQPALLYNMGRAEERLGLYPESLRNLEQFSRSASPELKARVPKLAELIAEVRSHVVAPLRTNLALKPAAVAVRSAVLGPGPTATDARASSVGHVRADGSKEGGAITSKWWFWTGIGVGVVGGIALTAVLLNGDKSAPRGDVAPGQASAALLRF